ncbi:MAG: hypothetical protein Alis3KO_24740 [Aliiglaciecola sp.]
MFKQQSLGRGLASYSIRRLTNVDGLALADYFLQMSNQTKQYFGPHPLDADYAQKLCLPDQIANDTDVRLVIVNQEEPSKIFGYFIVQVDVSENELCRYEEYGLPLAESKVVSYAPSMAEAMIGKGLGSQVFEIICKELIRLHYSTVVLMGGVQKRNTLAVHYYQKFGFKHVGSYYTEVENLDMILQL